MPTLKDEFKPIQIVHMALCAGLFFIIILLKYISDKQKITSDDDSFIHYIGVGIGVISIVGSRILFMNSIQQAKVTSDFRSKINFYRTAIIQQSAMLEGAGMINIILYFIFGNELNFAFSLAILFLMIFRRPTIENMIKFTVDEYSNQQKINENTIVD
ncbi:MAG: hypothetical protein IPK18_12310 [Sphingobacteriales bacterium]|jgi:hypothetical protein|nr:MAG: hypothetical protein IPK18_12310 [Sphingobacteriales bacterium]